MGKAVKPDSILTVDRGAVVRDGIDIAVNSDEELDYEDDLVEETHDPAEEDSDEGMEQTETDVDSEIMLGGTGSSMEDEKKLLQNPALRKLFNQLLDERIKQANQQGESSGSTLLSTMSPLVKVKEVTAKQMQ